MTRRCAFALLLSLLVWGSIGTMAALLLRPVVLPQAALTGLGMGVFYFLTRAQWKLIIRKVRLGCDHCTTRRQPPHCWENFEQNHPGAVAILAFLFMGFLFFAIRLLVLFGVMRFL